MKLRFLGKDSTPTNSPTLYATDQNSYVVQGWIVTDAEPEIVEGCAEAFEEAWKIAISHHEYEPS